MEETKDTVETLLNTPIDNISVNIADRSKFARYCRPKKGEAFYGKVFAYTFDFRPTSLYVDHEK